MFPILFHYINPEFFHHEVCQLSKHARNSYLIQGYKSISTFCIGSQWHMGTLQSRYYLGSLVVYFICWLPHSNHLGVLKKKIRGKHYFRSLNKMIQTDKNKDVLIGYCQRLLQFYTRWISDGQGNSASKFIRWHTSVRWDGVW